MQLKDLCSGDVVELRCGSCYIFLKGAKHEGYTTNLFLSKTTKHIWLSSSYNEDLTFKPAIGRNPNDIVKVCSNRDVKDNFNIHLIRVNNAITVLDGVNIRNAKRWTWERVEGATEYTLEELERKLGHKVMIKESGE